jgi:hypothetical protein
MTFEDAPLAAPSPRKCGRPQGRREDGHRRDEPHRDGHSEGAVRRDPRQHAGQRARRAATSCCRARGSDRNCSSSFARSSGVPTKTRRACNVKGARDGVPIAQFIGESMSWFTGPHHRWRPDTAVADRTAWTPRTSEQRPSEAPDGKGSRRHPWMKRSIVLFGVRTASRSGHGQARRHSRRPAADYVRP